MQAVIACGLNAINYQYFGVCTSEIRVFFTNWPKLAAMAMLASVADPGFPRGGGANPQSGGANLLLGQKFPENCMKMKEFGPRGGVRVPCAPLRSANGHHRLLLRENKKKIQQQNVTPVNMGSEPFWPYALLSELLRHVLLERFKIFIWSCSMVLS